LMLLGTRMSMMTEKRGFSQKHTAHHQSKIGNLKSKIQKSPESES
jgi:hypothetical protein